jgi:hypothetical protein
MRSRSGGLQRLKLSSIGVDYGGAESPLPLSQFDFGESDYRQLLAEELQDFFVALEWRDQIGAGYAFAACCSRPIQHAAG